MTINILHISDLHFGDPDAVIKRLDVEHVLSNLLAKTGSDIFLVLSGDISFKGQMQGYSEATETLHELLGTSIPRNRIIVCPGNHDIVKSAAGLSYFDAFDVWSAGLRSDKHCTFGTNSCRHVSYPEVDFLVINSAYHGDIEYGLVNLRHLDSTLAAMEENPRRDVPRVAVLHHHLIPFAGQGDKSTTRNAYHLLTRLIRHGFSLVLHGHQHALLEIGVGQGSMKLYGVGSFRYSTPGFINGASIYQIDEQNQLSADHYAISKDAPNFLRKFTDY